jgi:hypothetical protein
VTLQSHYYPKWLTDMVLLLALQAKAEKPKAVCRQRETAMEAFFKSAMRSIGTQIGGG